MKGLSVIFTVLLFALAIHLSHFLNHAGAVPLENHPVGPLVLNSTQGTSSYPAAVHYLLPGHNKFN
jgi:hypothetical protein